MTSDVLDEDNQWFCPHCREFVCAEKKLDIWKSSAHSSAAYVLFYERISHPVKLSSSTSIDDEESPELQPD